jgi:NAD(P)-dependent dehydrogenase (short-subunit alcohol dehydrogenase family)
MRTPRTSPDNRDQTGDNATATPEAPRDANQEAVRVAGEQERHRLPTLAELGNAAAFLASDRASGMTATLANVTCGAFLD